VKEAGQADRYGMVFFEVAADDSILGFGGHLLLLQQTV